MTTPSKSSAARAVIVGALLVVPLTSDGQGIQFYTYGTAAGVNFAQPKAMAVITPEGVVKIDWDEVERTLADPNSNRQTLCYARLIKAARQGTWHPMGTD